MGEGGRDNLGEVERWPVVAAPWLALRGSASGGEAERERGGRGCRVTRGAASHANEVPKTEKLRR